MSSNYFVRHWRGELSLPLSYWVNGTLLSGIVTGLLLASVRALVGGASSLRLIAWLSLMLVGVGLGTTLWSSVGIWRSAGRHASRGGSDGWALAARGAMVLGILALLVQSPALAPNIKDLGLIALGRDPVGQAAIVLSQDGRTALLRGNLGTGSASKVIDALDAAPELQRLVLESNGGRLHEAASLASYVRDRGLDTAVETACASACTYIFLAGRQRAATPNAVIGFHRPASAGQGGASHHMGMAAMAKVYRAAGLPQDFVDRVAKTPNDQIWAPTRDELWRYRIITRESLGGESLTAASVSSAAEMAQSLRTVPLFRRFDERFPGTIDAVAAQAWAAREAGGNDGAIGHAIRGVIRGKMPELLQSADDATLERLLRLNLSEMSAARALSAEACQKLTEGTLDVTQTLPAEVVAEDEAFMMQLLSLGPRSPQPLHQDRAQRAIARVAAGTPRQHMATLQYRDAFKNQPGLICDALIAFYTSAVALPDEERIEAARAILLSGM